MTRSVNGSDDLTEQVHIQLLRLKARFAGVVCGLLAAAGIFLATNFLILKGGHNVGAHLALLGQFFIGYRVTFVGSIIGAVYGLIVGYACGYAGARIYNWITDLRDKPKNRSV